MRVAIEAAPTSCWSWNAGRYWTLGTGPLRRFSRYGNANQQTLELLGDILPGEGGPGDRRSSSVPTLKSSSRSISTGQVELGSRRPNWPSLGLHRWPVPPCPRREGITPESEVEMLAAAREGAGR